MRMVLVILAGVLWWASADAACTGSSPTWTSTPDYASVNTCRSSASRGDTINVSAGSATWSSTLTLTKGVNLIGPGRDSLTITIGSQNMLLEIEPDATAIANEETIKVTGFTFNGDNHAGANIDGFPGMIGIEGAGASSAKPFKKLVLGDNRFKNPSQSGSSSVIYQRGHVRGVVYNNIFDRPKIPVRCFGNNEYAEYTNAAYMPVTAGSSDNLFFEDNTITWTTLGGDSGVNNWQGWNECGIGGRIVWRYNTNDYNDLSGNFDDMFDVHGCQSGNTGTMIAEYYGNKWLNSDKPDGTRWNFHRGGQGIYHNNVTSGTTSSTTFDISNWDTLGWDDQTGLTDCETNRTYAWNLTHNGTTFVPAWLTGSGYGAHHASTENSKWWKENASCSGSSGCTSGIGKGTDRKSVV